MKMKLRAAELERSTRCSVTPSDMPTETRRHSTSRAWRYTPIIFTVQVSLLALCAPARAQEWGPKLSLSGYGSLGIVRSSDDRSDFEIDAFKPNGPGRSRRWSADVDSRVAAQVTAEFTPELSGILQVVSQQRYDNSYAPTIEWANLKYQVTPDIAVRAGRIVLPVFLVSDSRKVGYANPWVRPPVEVYSLLPITSNDGVDASFRLGWGEATNTVQVTYGRSDTRFPGAPTAGIAKTRDLFVLVDTIEYGPVSARLSYGSAKLTIDAFKVLFDPFRQFGPVGTAIADKYTVDRKRVNFIGVGAGYDPGKWFAMVEWAKFDTRSILGARSAWYFSGGYRLGKFTPYLTYSKVKNDSNSSDPGLPVTQLPPQAAGTAVVLNAGLNALLAQTIVQKTISIGGRWDAASNIALKLQFDHVRRGAGSPGTFGNLQPGFVPGGKVSLLSATVDFVF